ncbi:hypothetical protein [Stappia sp. BW2]|nr:hypothetical protein [Stappia sp. BW2]
MKYQSAQTKIAPAKIPSKVVYGCVLRSPDPHLIGQDMQTGKIWQGDWL